MMADIGSRPRSSLARRISIRVAIVTLVTSVVRLLVIMGALELDYNHLALDHVRREAYWISRGIKVTPTGLTFELPRNMGHYADGDRNSYAFRVLEPSGQVIASKRAAILERISPWRPASDGEMPAFWFRELDDTRPFHFAGGKQFHIGGSDVLIEIATEGDPAGIHRWILTYETLEDVWLPILPFTIMIPLATLFSVRGALNFLTRGAQQAERVDPANPAQSIDFAEIPSEAAPFAVAIDRLLQRVSMLMHSYRVFMGCAAHELRTPLAAMLIELEMIDDPRARLLEKDVVGMSESVDRLLTLIRIQCAEPPDLVEVDVGAIVWDTIESLRIWARAHDHEINLDLQEAGTVRGDPVAMREAIRNLVENAVKHTPADTLISVSVKPGGTITVEDGGPGLPAQGRDQLFEPFNRGSVSTKGVGLGLTIVRRAVDLHHGSIEVGQSPLGGAMFRVRFA
jgi:two-component system, OmpR family, sensor histidine kinase QseC